LNTTEESIFQKAKEAIDFVNSCEEKLKTIDPSNLIDEWLE
jgi:hypothetical protein